MAECGIYHDSIWHILQFGGAIARSLTRAMTVRTQTGLAQYASISAFEDRRFNPITHDELAHLHCTVSLLVEFERGRDYLDWTVGVHGIRIELRDAATGNVVSATYLPEVASEQGWSKVQAIDSLLRKGGYRGKINDSIRSQISLERYKSARYNASYEQWRASRST
eukprot:m.33532 g.33532  ORF g.33532 m.33532 type:complete len:166 (+) comp14241_c0_seq2:650-1147(+)